MRFVFHLNAAFQITFSQATANQFISYFSQYNPNFSAAECNILILKNFWPHPTITKTLFHPGAPAGPVTTAPHLSPGALPRMAGPAPAI
jgi:hypothetical protein